MTSLQRLSKVLVAIGLALTVILTVSPVAGVSAAPIAPAKVTVPSGAEVASGRTCFKESGFCAENAFLDFWRTNGGVQILGYPIDEARRYPDGLIRQFYERAILEWHPENAAQYQVLLTRLGAGLIDGAPQTATPPIPCTQNCTLFRETNHTLRGVFSDYWNRYGGLPVFGLPLTEEFIEVSPTNGQPYVVQYFERNRFEYHPENSGRYQVLLGLLGSETLKVLGGDVRALPTATVPNYGAGATSPQIAALPLEGAVGSTFVFIFVGLRPNTEYSVLIATDSARSERVEDGVFRTDSNGVLVLDFDSSRTPPGGYLVGAFDGNGKLVVSTSFAIFFVPGS
ncbi:MAG TPA: hypothetical protein VIL85_22795 [Thermomicrobiales bacterium]